MLLLAAGVVNALVVSLLPTNLVNINVVHHYLGAKYPVPYSNFYEVINAAVEKPQIDMRDLDHPSAMRRSDPREQRAYYIDLLREAGVEFDPFSSLSSLAARANESGVVRREAERILGENLPADRIESFRRDARAALVGLGWDRDITTDYGFNGSPFYSLVRQIDPTLHKPFSRATALLNLAWQIAAVLGLAWCAGIALDLDITGRLSIAALVLASWDFVGWALPGLVFAGMWLPVGVALVAMRRRKAAPAGIAVAWAGLVKLFPFVLVIPFVSRLARAVCRRERGSQMSGTVRWSFGVLAWSALAVAVLGATATLTGRSWVDFLHKIIAEFQGKGYLLNSVSSTQGLLVFGVHDSPLRPALSLAGLAMLSGMFLGGGDEDFRTSLPRRSLVLLAAIGWIAHTWFNYYTIAPLLLLPLVARRRRVGAAAAAIVIALGFVLPEFDDPLLLSRPVLHGLKVAPYLFVPAWLVALEFKAMHLGRISRRILVAAVALCVVAAAGESLRMRTIDHLDDRGNTYLDRGDAQKAFEIYRRLTALAPRNATAHMNRAIALAILGRDDEAGAAFAHAAALAPSDAVIRRNYGHWLSKKGRLDEAAKELETALEITPYDPRILIELAEIRGRQGRESEATELALRALEVEPENPAARNFLKGIGRE